jgi:LuxR family maltose regulon positive regulatory protein
MPHTNLRELAFQMRSEELRQYGRGVLERDPSRQASAEILDLMAYLVECDFEGAEAKLATIKFKFKDSKEQVYVNEGTSLAKTHIDFAFGRFKAMEESADFFLHNHEALPNVEEGEFLDIMRLKAQKHMIMDEIPQLVELEKEVLKYEVAEASTNVLYLINSVKANLLNSQGYYLKAFEIATQNCVIANQNKYKGLMAPLDSLFVIACSKLSFGRTKEALNDFKELMNQAGELNQWPWYFIAEGYLARDLAYSNKMSDALEIVREQRAKMSTFSFRHELGFIPDVNELYVRYIINDVDRMEVLLKRVPQLHMVKSIKGALYEGNGGDTLKYIESFSDNYPREKIFKLISLADYYKDKESIAVDYMLQALKLVEETGYTEAILRQHNLITIVLKAINKQPTSFLEDLASKMSERINQNNLKNQGGMPVPLTSRELEVVRHLSTGKPISAISNVLHVSMNTMKTHLRNIYRKLDVDGRDTAVQKAKELYLI